MRLIDAVLDGLDRPGLHRRPAHAPHQPPRDRLRRVASPAATPRFLRYQLEQTASEGYVFVLVPTGRARSS
jgi:hypothetical protein